MEIGNVLVIGNSGVGKSTLINAVLGEEMAATGWGTKGTTDKLAIYEGEQVPFRIIDTVGFEPTFIKSTQAVNAVKKWSKDSAKEGNEETQINVIWFCIEGTSSKLFLKTIKDFSRATSMWKTVPVIVVITKSYSVPEREQNIEMVTNAFAAQKSYSKNLRKVIPVVASAYVLNDNAYAPPEGITDLIDATNELLPEGIKAGENDIAAFILNRKRAMAHGITATATAAAVVVGAARIPFSDAALLVPIEVSAVNALAQLYGISKNEETKQFVNSIVEVGTVSKAAKAAILTLKTFLKVKLPAGVLNAIIAGSIVAAIGEGTIYAFEQIYLGKKSITDIDWVKKVLESKLSSQFIGNVKSTAEKITQSTDGKTIANTITDTFKGLSSSSDSEKI